jgi:hypothetical protein
MGRKRKKKEHVSQPIPTSLVGSCRPPWPPVGCLAPQSLPSGAEVAITSIPQRPAFLVGRPPRFTGTNTSRAWWHVVLFAGTDGAKWGVCSTPPRRQLSEWSLVAAPLAHISLWIHSRCGESRKRGRECRGSSWLWHPGAPRAVRVEVHEPRRFW